MTTAVKDIITWRVNMTSKPIASLIEVKNYLGIESGEFAKEWKRLSDDDKQEIRERVFQEMEV